MAEATYENGIYRWTGEGGAGVRIMDRSGDRRLPIGDDGFESLAPRSVFVDKSMLVADVLRGNYKVTLFCRPRRFGKTLAMTMLKSFLELPPDGVSRAPLFEGLAVWDAEGGRWRAEQGVRPVVYISLNDVKKDDWPTAYGALEGKVAAEYARHAYLAQSPALTEGERAHFARVCDMRGSRNDVESSLRQLALYLARHHGRNAVVLIDEYDAPVMAARAGGYYREAVSFMKGWLTGALKDGGAALDFACLTGVQRIARESIFSDLNNLGVDTPLNRRFDERFGFTADEVAALSSYLGHPDKQGELEEWYDGYRFGDADIYNPWSVLNYLGNDCEPDVYWTNTASNSVIGEAVRSADGEGLRDVCELLQPGGFVWRPLDMGVVFPEAGASGDALWSMLYLAGYLTTEDTGRAGDQYLLRRLRIPNREIARVFRGEVVERFREVAGGADRLRRLHAAFVSGDAPVVQAELGRILMTGASCRDLISENSYHMLVMGLLFGVPGYGDPVSNREAGRGYYDLRLEPETFGGARSSLPVIVVEFKTLKAADLSAEPAGPMSIDSADLANRAVALAEAARKGLAQIREKAYDCDTPAGCIRYGMAFCGKDAAVVCEKDA